MDRRYHLEPGDRALLVLNPLRRTPVVIDRRIRSSMYRSVHYKRRPKERRFPTGFKLPAPSASWKEPAKNTRKAAVNLVEDPFTRTMTNQPLE